MVGEVKIFAGVNIPSNKYLRCDGQVLSKVLYPHLFNVIGYTYGGSGENFKLPDLTGRTPVGCGDASIGLGCLFEIGANGGVKNNILNVNNIPRHNHNVTGSVSVGVSSDFANTTDANAAMLGKTLTSLVYRSGSDSDGFLQGVSHNLSTDNFGVDEPSPIDNMQPYLVVPFIIQVLP